MPCLRLRMRNKKFNVQTFASEVMANVFLDSAEILLVVFLKRGAPVNSERFVKVKATNSKNAPKLEGASSHLPPISPVL